MPTHRVSFRYKTGIKKDLLNNARLRGSWDPQGVYSDQWTESPMQPIVADDGCPGFGVSLDFQTGQPGAVFKWGVVLDAPGGSNAWGIPTELSDPGTTDRLLFFSLDEADPDQEESFYLTYKRRLGANKVYTGTDAVANPDAQPGIRFSVWAPNAQSIGVVFGFPEKGYIDDAGQGIDPTKPPIPLVRGAGGIWQTAILDRFSDYEGLPYMYAMKNEQGNTVYRTDIFSRSQIGSGLMDPKTGVWPGTPETLDGTVSCSVVVDPDRIANDFATETDMVPAEEFWANEFSANRPLPAHISDLVIYELHVGALGFHHPATPGTLADAIQFLDHLETLGINAVELLPMAEFYGEIGWGYGDTHHFVIESAAGGRDQYRHFVRECHRRGIAVIQDVVYNHYDPDASRAEWQFDSVSPEHNIFYWYEGSPADYSFPEGGYIDNGSTGWAPRFWETTIRQQFISSAVFLIEEMHVDGLRVDLTQALHRDNSLHANGASVGNANLFGQKFLREWSRTLKMIHPDVMLIAEDHTGWDAVTRPAAAGGLGFDATWYADFYHALVGDSDFAGGKPRILKEAGFGDDRPLLMDQLSSFLYSSQFNKVVFQESHDEAGNAQGTARTMVIAANYSPIFGDTRVWAERRSRVAFGLSLLSPGIPMFFMGEETAALKNYTVNSFLGNREDLEGDRAGIGAGMFRYYQDLIKLSRRLGSVRGSNIDILHVNNDGRVIVFKRWSGDEQVLIAVSFNNNPFPAYTVDSDPFRLPDGGWKEIFNSDAALYGGTNTGNGGAVLNAAGGSIRMVLPASGLLVFVH
ncbi:MAG TPA: alpha-amylase family glycosyl hydrolase [Puia sp.]|nr:alpha-amylase family glycosyl hydrolase [Puia sp.]